MIKIALFKIEEFLKRENDNLPLWYVSFYLFGILFYFSLNFEPEISYIMCATLIVSLLSFLNLRRNSSLFGSSIIGFLLRIALSFLLGISISSYKTNSLTSYVATPEINNQLKNLKIKGTITKIKPTPFGSQITLDEVSTNDKRINHIPERVRINFGKYGTKYLITGDRILVKTDIFPPSSQIMPGGYNFKQVAYFNKISAIGRAKNEPEIISYSDKGFLSLVSGVRRIIYYHLLKNLGNSNGNFAAALFLGETGGIDQTTLKNMRFSGISHILCVSGLHLSLIAGIFFLVPRILLNFSNYIASHFDIKKIAGAISILFSFVYLLLTGMQIAATRAFIMTTIVMLSIILERQPFPLRSLSLACFIILTLNPEYAIQPSFQLSFIAVLSLLIGYEFYVSSKNLLGRSRGIFASIKLYLYANIYSSLIASLATSPVVMYHFYVYSNYSVLANLVAVPIVSFILMPFGVLAFVLYPIGASFPCFYIINKSISVIKYVAQNIMYLPKAIVYTGYVNDFAIMLFIFSFLWISIWKSSIRFYGFVGFIICIFSFLNQTK